MVFAKERKPEISKQTEKGDENTTHRGVVLTSFEVFEISSNAVLRCLIYFLNFNQNLLQNAKIYTVLTDPFVSLKNKRLKLESQYISRELCLISLSLK